ncbi:MAG: PAC2 family protein [Acidimicrobiales bacterium]
MSLFHRLLDLDQPLTAPVLVLGMDGWIDAGLGAGTAVGHLLSIVPTEVLGTFDREELIDYRARRPMVPIDNGIAGQLSWPEIRLHVGTDPAGQDLLVLVGPEPDMRWSTFVHDVVELSAQLGVRLVASVGAFPLSVPHTRPVRLAATGNSRELVDQVGVVPGTMEVPAGIHAALQEGFGDADIPAIGMWARVPMYAAGMPYPAASAALIEGLARVAGLQLDAGELHEAAALAAARIGDLIASSEEHQEMVRQLEAAVDAEESAPPLDFSNLPSGDEIGAELERFLRGENPGGA